MKDIEIIDIDYSGSNTLYKREEKFKVAEIPAPWIVPGEGPFYGEGVRLLNGGTPLVKEIDYTLETPVPQLTTMLGKAVYLHIELKDHILASVTEIDVIYQKVGDPILSRNKLLELLENALISGGTIDYETQISGKPKTFAPAAHQMDVRETDEMVGFGNMVLLFTLMKSRIDDQSKRVIPLLKAMQDDSWTKLDYIYNLRWQAIMHHARMAVNPHGVTPADVDIEHIENFHTASIQQDAEGVRDDLYSTPAGLARLIEESEPDPEEYIFQNELPFSYYGSGIYLPPSITGSFEGLGGDIENSCFVREGNGWLVGLMRQFDGRVRNLYYVYQSIMIDRYTITDPILTYHPYNHPDLIAKSFKPEYVIAGSGNDVIAVADTAKLNRVMFSLTNGTLDPASHKYIEIDYSTITAFDRGFNLVGGLWLNTLRTSSVAKVGDYIYIIFSNSNMDNIPANELGWSDPNGPSWGYGENMTQFIFRFPVSAFNTPGSVVIPQPVTLTYDNFTRERKTTTVGFPGLRLIRYRQNAQGKVIDGAMTYTKPCEYSISHRRRVFIVVQDPNNKDKCRIKVIFPTQSSWVEGGNNGTTTPTILADFNVDFAARTWDLDPKWKKPRLNFTTNTLDGLSEADLQYVWAGRTADKMVRGYIAQAHSLIPGFGTVCVGSLTTGSAPFNINFFQMNTTGDPANDFASTKLPHLQIDAKGNDNFFVLELKMPSPVGLGSFPRFFSDIYRYNNQNNTTPIELFCGDMDTKYTGTVFNRMPEPGDGLTYKVRTELQCSFIPKRILGRAPNAKIGKTVGCDYWTPICNYPQLRDEKSTFHSMSSFFWQKSKNGFGEAGVIPNPFRVSETDPEMIPQIDPVSKDLLFSTSLNWQYNELSKQLTASNVPAKTIRLTQAQHMGFLQGYFGAAWSKVQDIAVQWYLAPYPGPESATNTPSFMHVYYHNTGEGQQQRAFVIKFNWNNNGTYPDGTLAVTLTNPVSVGYSDWTKTNLLPPTQYNGSQQDVSTFYQMAVDANGNWINLFWKQYSHTARKAHTEIYSFGSAAKDLVMFSYSGVYLTILGNMVSSIFMWDNRTGTNKAILAMLPINAPIEYPNTTQAIPGWGIVPGVSMNDTGNAVTLLSPDPIRFQAIANNLPATDAIMVGATFVQSNWTVFVNSDVGVTFNGYSMIAAKRAFDLRDFAAVYKDSVFFLYCIARGNVAEYELTKTLKQPDGNCLLVAKVTTNQNGIATIKALQQFCIAGYPLTRVRDAGIPVSSGGLNETGSYKFIKESELYSGSLSEYDRSVLDITINNRWPRKDGITDPPVPLP